MHAFMVAIAACAAAWQLGWMTRAGRAALRWCIWTFGGVGCRVERFSRTSLRTSGCSKAAAAAAEVKVKLARLAMERAAWQEAAAYLTSALALDYNSAECFMLRSECHRELDQTFLAYLDACNAIELLPSCVEAYRQKGLVEITMNRGFDAFTSYYMGRDLCARQLADAETRLAAAKADGTATGAEEREILTLKVHDMQLEAALKTIPIASMGACEDGYPKMNVALSDLLSGAHDDPEELRAYVAEHMEEVATVMKQFMTIVKLEAISLHVLPVSEWLDKAVFVLGTIMLFVPEQMHRLVSDVDEFASSLCLSMTSSGWFVDHVVAKLSMYSMTSYALAPGVPVAQRKVMARRVLRTVLHWLYCSLTEADLAGIRQHITRDQTPPPGGADHPPHDGQEEINDERSTTSSDGAAHEGHDETDSSESDGGRLEDGGPTDAPASMTEGSLLTEATTPPAAASNGQRKKRRVAKPRGPQPPTPLMSGADAFLQDPAPGRVRVLEGVKTEPDTQHHDDAEQEWYGCYAHIPRHSAVTWAERLFRPVGPGEGGAGSGDIPFAPHASPAHVVEELLDMPDVDLFLVKLAVVVRDEGSTPPMALPHVLSHPAVAAHAMSSTLDALTARQVKQANLYCAAPGRRKATTEQAHAPLWKKAVYGMIPQWMAAQWAKRDSAAPSDSPQHLGTVFMNGQAMAVTLPSPAPTAEPQGGPAVPPLGAGLAAAAGDMSLGDDAGRDPALGAIGDTVVPTEGEPEPPGVRLGEFLMLCVGYLALQFQDATVMLGASSQALKALITATPDGAARFADLWLSLPLLNVLAKMSHQCRQTLGLLEVLAGSGCPRITAALVAISGSCVDFPLTGGDGTEGDNGDAMAKADDVKEKAPSAEASSQAGEGAGASEEDVTEYEDDLDDGAGHSHVWAGEGDQPTDQNAALAQFGRGQGFGVVVNSRLAVIPMHASFRQCYLHLCATLPYTPPPHGATDHAPRIRTISTFPLDVDQGWGQRAVALQFGTAASGTADPFQAYAVPAAWTAVAAADDASPITKVVFASEEKVSVFESGGSGAGGRTVVVLSLGLGIKWHRTRIDQTTRIWMARQIASVALSHFPIGGAAPPPGAMLVHGDDARPAAMTAEQISSVMQGMDRPPPPAAATPDPPGDAAELPPPPMHHEEVVVLASIQPQHTEAVDFLSIAEFFTAHFAEPGGGATVLMVKDFEGSGAAPSVVAGLRPSVDDDATPPTYMISKGDSSRMWDYLCAEWAQRGGVVSTNGVPALPDGAWFGVQDLPSPVGVAPGWMYEDIDRRRGQPVPQGDHAATTLRPFVVTESDLAKTWSVLEILVKTHPEMRSALDKVTKRMQIPDKRVWVGRIIKRTAAALEEELLAAQQALGPNAPPEDLPIAFVECAREEDHVAELHRQYGEKTGLGSDWILGEFEVRFKDETSVGSALMREWMDIVASHVFLPPHRHILSPLDDRSSGLFLPSMAAVFVNPHWRQDFELLGRLLGLALYHQVTLDLPVHPVVYDCILHASDSVEDVLAPEPGPASDVTHTMHATAALFPSLVKHKLRWVQEADDLDELGMDLLMTDALDVPQKPVDAGKEGEGTSAGTDGDSTSDDSTGLLGAEARTAALFRHPTASKAPPQPPAAVAPEEMFVAFPGDVLPGDPAHEQPTLVPQALEVELVPGGRDIPITAGNKGAWVEAVAEYRVRNGMREQIGMIRRGFEKVVPAGVLREMRKMLRGDDLFHLISGEQALDLEDWKAHTRYEGGLHEGSKEVQCFWDVLAEWQRDDPPRLEKLLQFACGSRRVPVGGFKYLVGYNGGLHRFTLERGVQLTAASLPTAHACICTVDLPPWRTLAAAREKLSVVTDAGMQFVEH
eukprot:TRINITY_DN2782_c0_g2_i1.p1 TRINITY_DN2782_c0_g2~~TRINITY_DN2782_c0_g2_i1.p1  ORF type:complete len:1862 (+),score=486.70 TRINITY_DN2782_c0_g2_i1:98-5683(+)